MALSTSKTLVIQAFPGIGDMIWYLPYIKAIARQEGPVTVLTKSRTLAQQWLVNDPLISDVIYADRRSLSLSVGTVRRRHFQKAWTLHRSFSYALVPWLARIPNRVGYGFEAQRWLLTTSHVLSSDLKSEHTLVKLRAMMQLMGLTLRPEDQRPPLCPLAEDRVLERYKAFPRPWICFGVGGSEPLRRWPLDRFQTLGHRILQQGQGTLFLCGSTAEQEDIHFVTAGIEQINTSLKSRLVPVTDLSIREAFALMKHADLYVGNDTSLLNISASLDTTAVGLFGGSTPLTYSSYIKVITATDQPSQQSLDDDKQGMKAIAVDDVWNTLKDLSVV